MNKREADAQRTRTDAAAYLRNLADHPDADGAVTPDFAGQQVTMDPTGPITPKREAESEQPAGAAQAKGSIEVELVWWCGTDPTEASSETEPSPE